MGTVHCCGGHIKVRRVWSSWSHHIYNRKTDGWINTCLDQYLFYVVQNLCRRWVPLRVHMGVLVFISLIMIIPYKHVQRPVLQVIINPVKFAINTNQKVTTLIAPTIQTSSKFTEVILCTLLYISMEGNRIKQRKRTGMLRIK